MLYITTKFNLGTDVVGLVENAGTRICGYADMRVCRYAGMRICGYAGMRICGYADMRVCGYAGIRVRRTGLTKRFQKLINNSNKIIAVNTKNHSCEGVCKAYFIMIKHS